MGVKIFADSASDMPLSFFQEKSSEINTSSRIHR